MRERERHPAAGGDAAGPDAGPNTDALAGVVDLGARLLAAADNAISRGLSRDSTAFLSSIRQQGGE